MALSTAYAGPAGADIVNGRLQSLKAHRAGHQAPPSLAQDAPRTAAPPTPKPYGGTPTDVLTYHYDQSRTGWNPTETDLTPATVASAKFTRLAVLKVDGNVFAQPLVVTNYKMPDASVHDVLIIVTGHDTVYAYDAKTYAILWQKSMGTPQATADVGCNDVKPEYGISSTPVIQRNKNGTATLYLVAATENVQYAFHSYLHALDLGTGNDLVTPQEINPSATLSDGSTVTFDPQNQWSRAGLALANGSVYVSIGSHCDNNSYSITGWELRYSTKTLAQMSAFHTIELSSNTTGNLELASIWMTGFAPAIDSTGHVFVVTGNGDFTKNRRDWGESVLRLNPSLSVVLNKFTPSDYDSLNGGDTDLGSGGVMLLPPVAGQTVPPLAIAMGKSSTLYLLNQTLLGNEQPNDAGVLQEQYAGGNGLWGGPAFFNGTNGPMVFAQTDSDVMRGYAVATTGTPSLTPTLSGTTSAGYGGTTPVISSNGTANGVLWEVRRSNPISFEAYDASKLGAPLFSQNTGVWSNQSNQNPFVAPVEANGRVYAPGYLTVTVFGLKE
jgi:hypothetical protein